MSSENLGTIRPPVAMAMSSISGPPTHRTAGRSFWRSKWLASSSKPHWQMARVAPESLGGGGDLFWLFDRVIFSYFL